MTFFLKKYHLLQPLHHWRVLYPHMYTSVSGDAITDEALVKAVLKYDKDAFRLLIKRYEKLVIQMVYRMVKRPEDQKDLCQEVFMKVYDKLGTFRFGSKLSTWIGTIAFNTCVNFLRTNRMLLVYDAPANDDEEENRPAYTMVEDSRKHPDELLLRKEQLQLLWRFVDELPAIQKTILGLFHQQELTIDEIAAMLNMPTGTIKSYLHRARQTLKSKFVNGES